MVVDHLTKRVGSVLAVDDSAPLGGALLAGYAAAFVLLGTLVTSRRDVT